MVSPSEHERSKPKKGFRATPYVGMLVVGVAIGAAASWGLLLAPVDVATPVADGLLRWVIPLLSGFAICLAIMLPLVLLALRRLLANASGSLEAMVSESKAAFVAVNDKKMDVAAQHASNIANEVIAWYAPIAARRWIAQTALSLIVTLGGLAGTALLFRQTVLLAEQNNKLQEQTRLLSSQNDKMDIQNILVSAQRGAVITSEMSKLFDALASQALLPTEAGSEAEPKISPKIASLVRYISSLARPYLNVRVEGGDQRAGKFESSPERGELFNMLLDFGYSPRDVVGTSASFDRMEISDKLFYGTEFSHIVMGSPIFSSVTFIDLHMDRMLMISPTFMGGSFWDVKAEQANFTGAEFSYTILNNVNLKCAILEMAQFEAVQFSGVSMIGVRLFGAKFINIGSFAGVDLRGAMISRPGQEMPVELPSSLRHLAPEWDVYSDRAGNVRLKRAGDNPEKVQEYAVAEACPSPLLVPVK